MASSTQPWPSRFGLERGKQEREQKKWAEENPLWALAERQTKEEEAGAGLVPPDGAPEAGSEDRTAADRKLLG